MKRLTTLIVGLFLTLALTSFAVAQDAGPRGGGPKGEQAKRQQALAKIHKQVIAELNLSTEQLEAVKKADKDRADAMKELRAKAKEQGDKEAMKEQVSQVQKEYREALKSALGEENFLTYQKRMKEELAKLKKDK